MHICKQAASPTLLGGLTHSDMASVLSHTSRKSRSGESHFGVGGASAAPWPLLDNKAMTRVWVSCSRDTHAARSSALHTACAQVVGISWKQRERVCVTRVRSDSLPHLSFLLPSSLPPPLPPLLPPCPPHHALPHPYLHEQRQQQNLTGHRVPFFLTCLHILFHVRHQTSDASQYLREDEGSYNKTVNPVSREPYSEAASL